MKSARAKRPHGRPNGNLQIKGQKRSWNGEASDYTDAKRYQLTEKNLRRHQCQEEPTLETRKIPANDDRRSYITNNTTTTDRQFSLRLKDNGIVFEQARTSGPNDLSELKAALAMELKLPADADMDFQNILEAKEEMAHGELSLESTVIETMLLKCPRGKYHRFRSDQWTEIDNEISAGISDPKPDVTETYLWSAYPAHTRDDFGDLAPTQYGYSMPTFAMESKGEGDAGQGVKQAAYDGAIMTHASIAAEERMGKTDLDSNTKAITATLTPSEVCIYANYAIKDQSNGKVAYHQHRVEKISYMDSENDWKRACKVIRNAQMFAQNLADSRILDIRKYSEVEDARLKELKVEQDKLEAEAKVQQERRQAQLIAEREKRQAEAKAERQKRQAEAKTERQRRQAEAKAETKAQKSMSAPSTKNVSTAKRKKAASKTTASIVNQPKATGVQKAGIDSQASREPADVCV